MLPNPEQIQELNSHWSSNHHPQCQYQVKRDVFDRCARWLKDRQIISIQGLRRTGKSVLLEQLRDAYVSEHNTPPKNYIYYSFDNEDLGSLLPASYLEEVFKFFFSRILNTHAQEIREKTLFCFDEIQNIDGWQAVIKKYYDLNSNFKFIISGSSSLYLKATSESLVGRILDFYLEPLSFGEFLALSGHGNLATVKNMKELLSLPPQILTSQRVTLFTDFLTIGGFPESATMFSGGKSVPEIHRYLRDSVISKVLTKDLRKYFGVEADVKDLLLFKVVCNETGAVFNYKNIANDINIDQEIVSKHLKVYSKASLTNQLLKFDTKLRKVINSHPKIYVSSACLVLAYLGHTQIPLGSLIGHLVEGYVHQRLRALTTDRDIYYTQPAQGKEIDFYLPHAKLLIECKYADTLSKTLMQHYLDLGRKFAVRPIVITKQDWGNSDIVALPAAFL